MTCGRAALEVVRAGGRAWARGGGARAGQVVTVAGAPAGWGRLIRAWAVRCPCGRLRRARAPGRRPSGRAARAW